MTVIVIRGLLDQASYTALRSGDMNWHWLSGPIIPCLHLLHATQTSLQAP